MKNWPKTNSTLFVR